MDYGMAALTENFGKLGTKSGARKQTKTRNHFKIQYKERLFQRITTNL
jgi:hypothetical protein